MAHNDKITVIGFKNAGKTTYLAGMYDLLSYGLKRFYLHASPDDDQYLTLLWDNISDGNSRKWPVPTDSKHPYTFRLSYDLKAVQSFDWLDYPGRALIDPDLGMYDEMVKEIRTSTCVLLLVNGESFAVDADSDIEYKSTVAQKLKKNKDLLMAKKLGDIADDSTFPPVVIVVTKSDLIPRSKDHLVKSILQDNFEAVFGKSDSKERLVMVTDVTLGEEITLNEDAAPVNIEEPIAFAVLAMLKRRGEIIRAAKNKNQNIVGKQRGFIDRWLDADEIREAQVNLEKEEKEAAELARKVVHLLELFDEDKTVYKNGEPVSLHDYFYKMTSDLC